MGPSRWSMSIRRSTPADSRSADHPDVELRVGGDADSQRSIRSRCNGAATLVHGNGRSGSVSRRGLSCLGMTHTTTRRSMATLLCASVISVAAAQSVTVHAAAMPAPAPDVEDTTAQTYGPQAGILWPAGLALPMVVLSAPVLTRVLESMLSYCAPDASGDDYDEAQELIDCLGLIPIVGIFLDLGNASISVFRGDYGAAVGRVVFAVPVIGHAAVARIILRAKAKPIAKVVENIKGINGSDIAVPTRWVPPKATQSTVVEKVEFVPKELQPQFSDDVRNQILKIKASARRVDGAAETRTNMTIDHLVPRSMGGGNEFHNLRFLTDEANNIKADVEREIKQSIKKLSELNPNKPPPKATLAVETGTPDLSVVPEEIVMYVSIEDIEAVKVAIPNISKRTITVTAPKSITAKPGSVRASAALETLRLADRLRDLNQHDPAPPTMAEIFGEFSDQWSEVAAPTLHLWFGGSANHLCDGCRWVFGSGENWTPGARYDVFCSINGRTVASTVGRERVRNVSPSGWIAWDLGVCATNARATDITVQAADKKVTSRLRH